MSLVDSILLLRGTEANGPEGVSTPHIELLRHELRTVMRISHK
jgi:hypothetical protein